VTFLAGFDDGMGGVLINRFTASSKLMPCNLRSMAFGIWFLTLLASTLPLFFRYQKPKIKTGVERFI